MVFLMLFLLSCAFIPGPARADIVKCVERGQVSYREHSCTAGKADTGHLPRRSPDTATQQIPAIPPIIQPPAPLDDSVASTVKTTESLTVRLLNGSYHVRGEVLGVQVNFQVDTGASQTAISRRIADAAGLTQSNCSSRVNVATAAGMTTACVVNIYELTFGTFSTRNVQAIILPELQPDALLGMDVLQGYTIEQRARALTISR